MAVAQNDVGSDVFHWSEYIALAKRLGINMNPDTTRVVIDIELESIVKIEQTYFAKHRRES